MATKLLVIIDEVRPSAMKVTLRTNGSYYYLDEDEWKIVELTIMEKLSYLSNMELAKMLQDDPETFLQKETVNRDAIDDYITVREILIAGFWNVASNILYKERLAKV